MSLHIAFSNNRFALKRQSLPSRYFHFNDAENYVKLVCIGEGIFPKDRVKTRFDLTHSSCVVSSESATKVYPSPGDEFGYALTHISLVSSNIEYLNDEMILFEKAKLMQGLHLHASHDSSFFYSEILTPGRSFEVYDFDRIITKNRFIIDGRLEYLEQFDLDKIQIKSYLSRRRIQTAIFAKVYIKTSTLEQYETLCYKREIGSFGYSQNRQMLIGVLRGSNMVEIKQKMMQAWHLYRELRGFKAFHLGKW